MSKISEPAISKNSTVFTKPTLKIQSVDEEIEELFNRKDLIEAVEEALNAVFRKQAA